MKLKPEESSSNRRFVWLGLVVFLLFLGSFLARGYLASYKNEAISKEADSVEYRRIVALAPSLVELIYLLGIEDRLVGISRFCNYPEEAKETPVVGGYLDLNFEKVLVLKPDCVLLLKEQKPVAEKLQSLGIDSILVDHGSIDGVIKSLSICGEAFNNTSKATTITSHMRDGISKIQNSVPNNSPRVLVCIGRDTASPFITKITAAGNKGVHQEYISIAGGENAYQGSVAFPTLSREKIIKQNPDIIIDLISDETWKNVGEKKLLQQWNQYQELNAVRNKQVILLHGDKHFIPGPRFVETLEIFSQTIQQYELPEE